MIFFPIVDQPLDSISFWRFNYSTLNLITRTFKAHNNSNLIERHAGGGKFNYFNFV